MASTRRTLAVALRSVTLTGLLAACGSPAAPVAPARAVPSASAAAAPAKSTAPPAKSIDPCDESKPLEKTYTGLLRAARCDQERFLIMAGIAEQLGVDCAYCHVRLADDPKKFDYPVMTPRKEIANWMGRELMASLRTTDGSPMKCSQCHVDASGKPKAKFLGDPRKPVPVQEWMATVMVNRFRTADGDKLRCKSCHADNFTKPGWAPKVILQTALLPPRRGAQPPSPVPAPAPAEGTPLVPAPAP